MLIGTWEVEPEAAQEKTSTTETSLVKRRLLSGGAWATVGKAVTAFTALATSALLARLLSPQHLGLYFLAFSIVQVGALVGSLGLDQAVVRFVAENVGLNHFARARRALDRTLVLAGLGTLGTGIAYLFVGRFIGNGLFSAPALTAVTTLVALWIAVMGLQQLLAGVFRAFHDIRLSTVFGGLMTSVLVTASLGILWLLRDRVTLSSILLLAVGSGFVNVLLAGWLLRRKIAYLSSRGGERKVGIGFTDIMHVAWPLMVTNLTIFVLTQADLWILGAFRPPEEVAVYGAAARAVVLVAMPLIIVGNVVPPLIAEMYSQGREQQLERILRASATVAGIPAFLTLATFILFGGPILELVFGDYFRGGATILALLSLAHLINVWTGAGTVTLSYTGHQAAMMTITVATGLTTVLAALAVVGSYGATGVAATVATGISAYNLVLWLVVKRKTGMWTHVGLRGFSDALRALSRTNNR